MCAFCMTIANAYTRMSKIIVCSMSMDVLVVRIHNDKGNGTKTTTTTTSTTTRRKKKGMYKPKRVHTSKPKYRTNHFKPAERDS